MTIITVIPAQAGIQCDRVMLDPHFRQHDDHIRMDARFRACEKIPSSMIP
jgi:hypothetical protein